jgi:hypothetical protein
MMKRDETEATPPKINRKPHPAHFVDNRRGLGFEVPIASGQSAGKKFRIQSAIDLAGNIARA